jgi:mannosyltransferase
MLILTVMVENVFTQSIWGDEGFSAILSEKSVFQIINIISHDTSPPLWNLFEHFAFQIFGPTEVVIRSLSLAFYLIAVIFAYKITRIFFSKKRITAILALLLTAFNPFFFTYAFEGRMYSILAAGVAGSMYFFIKTFFDEGSPKTRLGYIIMTLWALYSHHFAIFAIFLQGLWWLYELALGRRKTAKKFFKAFLIIGLGYIPWLYPLYTQTKMVGGGFWLGTPTLTDLRNLIYEYLAEGIKDNSFKFPYTNQTYYHVALYFVFAILILRKWWRSKKKTLFLILWFLGPILLTWFVSQKFQSIFFNRYLLYAIPPAMILISSARSKLSFIPIFILIFLFGCIDYQYFTHPTKLPFRKYSEMVKLELQPGDFLINWNSNGTHHIWETKFYGIPAPIYSTKKGNDLPFFVGTALMGPDDIVTDIPGWVQRIGVITSGPPEEVSIQGFNQNKIEEIDKLKFIILTPAIKAKAK